MIGRTERIGRNRRMVEPELQLSCSHSYPGRKLPNVSHDCIPPAVLSKMQAWQFKSQSAMFPKKFAESAFRKGSQSRRFCRGPIPLRKAARQVSGLDFCSKFGARPLSAPNFDRPQRFFHHNGPADFGDYVKTSVMTGSTAIIVCTMSIIRGRVTIIRCTLPIISVRSP